MTTVYLAEDLKHHRKVAVKVLRTELAAQLAEMQERLDSAERLLTAGRASPDEKRQ